MKITLDAQALDAALGDALAAKNSPMASLNHVLLEAGDGALWVQSTDTLAWLATRIPCEIVVPGAAAPNFRLLRSALAGLTGEITLEDGENGVLVLRQARRRFRIAAAPRDDWPEMEAEQGEAFNDDPAALADAIQRVGYAAGKGDQMRCINGVHLAPDVVVATDRYRIAVYPIETGIPEGGVIVPTEGLDKLGKHLHRAAAAHLIYGQDRHPAAILCTGESERFRLQLLDAQYVDWRGGLVEPEQMPARITLPADELRAALRRLLPFTERVADGHRFSLVVADIDGDELRLHPSQETETIEVVQGSLDGTPECSSFGFNVNYLLPSIHSADGPITWHLSRKPDQVQMFTFDGRDDYAGVMPCR